MANEKNESEERSAIVHRPEKRPYGVKVRFQLQTGAAFGDVGSACVPLHSGAFITIGPGKKAPWEGGRKFQVMLEGFATAASAEAAGRRLVMSLLWMAVTVDFPLRLEYQSYEPAAVFERNRSAGLTVEAYGEAGYAPDAVLGELRNAYSDLSTADQTLLLSMEIYCAARLETSQRAIFLALVSALEPLARAESLGPDVANFIDQCVAALQANGAIQQEAKDSIRGRLNQLREESIRQALRRLVKSALPDDHDAPRTIDAAYALRSQLVHAGVPADLDVDLEDEGRKLSSLIRTVYAGLLKRALARPAAG